MQQFNYLGANKKRLIKIVIILWLILLGSIIFLLLKIFKLESQLRQLSSVEIKSAINDSKESLKTIWLRNEVVSGVNMPSMSTNAGNLITSWSMETQDAISKAEVMMKILEKNNYDISVCNSFNGIDKYNCIYTVAIIKWDNRLCKLIPSSSWFQEECFDQIERDKKAFPDDLDICVEGSASDAYDCINNWIYTNIPSSKSSCNELESFLKAQSTLLLQEGISYESLLKDCKQIEKEIQQAN